ncbi:MAG TPA: hypothetical protein VNK23_07405 [Candidatus Dormibacteraeota bacterium]|nr:hypothetical protein [Candidatus Dormibacteraeota bacterium]
MLLRSFLAVVVFLLGIPAAAFACTCSQSAPGKCAGLQSGSVVFLGKVTGAYAVAAPAPTTDGASASGVPAADDTEEGGSSAPVTRYHFEVEERFSGPKASTTDIFSGGDDGDCGYRFKTGAEYLVYTHEGADGRLYSTICDGTRPAADARALIPQLRAMRDGQRVASVFGIVRRVDPPFLDPPNAPDPPVARVTIHLRSRWDRFETATDGTGVYSLYDVHAGVYNFSAHLPARMVLTEHNLASGLHPFELPAGACFEYDVDALPTGEIRGSILNPEGKPLPLAAIELYREGSYSEDHPGLWGFQGSKGVFDFDHVGPGRYILVFNRRNSLDPNSPFPRAFYPGVSDLSDAKPIVLKGGERLLDLKMKLSQGIPTRHLRVRIRFLGPRPLGTVTVTAQADHGDNPATQRIGPDLYEFALLDSASYTVSAWQDLIPQHIPTRRGAPACVVPARINAPPVSIPAANAPLEQITLAFPALACSNVAP